MAIEEYSVPTFRGGVLLTEMAEPSTPASGSLALFTGTDGYVYAKNDAGQVWGIRPPPQYSAYVGGSSSISNLTPANTYVDFAGQPSLTVNVPNSGVVRVTVGLKAAHTTAGSSVRVDVSYSGHPPNNTGGVVTLGAGESGRWVTGQRTTLHTGLTPGSLAMKVQATTSNTSGEFLNEAWLLVQPIP